MTKRYMLSLAIATLGLGLALPAFAGVILNEIDYDQPSTDTAEWIELYNPDNVAQSLVDLDLVLVNGSNCLTYGTIGLDAITIPAQRYVVIGNIQCATTLATLLASNAIQNGAPDDILIQDRNTLNILDSVEYE